MSIKSDRWIARMAREHQMIEPFAEIQFRSGTTTTCAVLSPTVRPNFSPAARSWVETIL